MMVFACLVFICRVFLSSFSAEILHHKAGKGEAEDGGRVGYGSVHVHLLLVPVDGSGVAPTDICFWTIGLTTLFGFARENFLSTCKHFAFILDDFAVFQHPFAFVRQHFGGVDDAELAGREQFGTLELLPEGTRQRTTFDLPELVDANLRGVHLQSGTHRRKELDMMG